MSWLISAGGESPRALCGSIQAPADKSVSHRAILFSALARGRSVVRANLFGRDNFATLRAIEQLGVTCRLHVPERLRAISVGERIRGVSSESTSELLLEILSPGRAALRPGDEIFDCGNSGTTSRLLCGLLAGLACSATLDGDDSLRRRPFDRVAEPLALMGASFSSVQLPLKLTGRARLNGICHISRRASAQVKTALLLAGLATTEEVSIIEPHCSRDHTERFFRAQGVELESAAVDGAWRVCLPAGGARELAPGEFTVPGDFSSAAFFMVAASLVPGSDVLLENVGINPTRIGLLEILERMGADIQLSNQREQCGEPVADLRVRAAQLSGTAVNARDVVYAIDEIPILAVAAAMARGRTEIHGAAELRVKESDRLAQIAKLLRWAGVAVEEFEDGLAIEGGAALRAESGPDDWRASGDHRISMAGAVLEYLMRGQAKIIDSTAVETSYPNFSEHFQALISGR